MSIISMREFFRCFSLRLTFGSVLFWATIASPVSAQTIDTTSSWNGSSNISAWGVPNTATYGQTITTNYQTTLNSVSFYVKSLISGSVTCGGYIYEWDGTKAIGAPLYSSASVTVPSTAVFTTVTLNTGGVTLAAGKTYVVLLTTSNLSGQANATYSWGLVSNKAYAGGQFVYINNGTDFSQLTTTKWAVWNGDLAFIMLFAPSATGAVEFAGYSSARGAAQVIDSHSLLESYFSGVSSSDSTYANAVIQTLPLLTGSSIFVEQSVLGSVSNIVQARQGAVFNESNFWVKPFGSWADQNDQEGGVAGYRANTTGFVIGHDAAISGKRRLGLALAYAHSSVDSKSSAAPQNAALDFYQLLGYGSTLIAPDTDINYQIGIGQNTTEGHRTLTFLSGVANSSYQSPSFTAGLGLRKTIKLDSKTHFSPSIRIDYTWLNDRAYQETGPASIAPLLLNVDSRTVQELVVGANTKLNHKFNSSTSVNVNAGLGYDMLNEQNSITAAFAGAPGAPFITTGLSRSPWLARIGLEFVHQAKNGPEISARYDGDFRHGYVNNSASVNIGWSF